MQNEISLRFPVIQGRKVNGILSKAKFNINPHEEQPKQDITHGHWKFLCVIRRGQQTLPIVF